MTYAAGGTGEDLQPVVAECQQALTFIWTGLDASAIGQEAVAVFTPIP
jgi:hypothetical protein